MSAQLNIIRRKVEAWKFGVSPTWSDAQMVCLPNGDGTGEICNVNRNEALYPIRSNHGEIIGWVIMCESSEGDWFPIGIRLPL